MNQNGNPKKKNKSKAQLSAQTADSLSKRLDQLLSRIPKGTFATVGGALGGPTGALVGKGVSAITGYGDYTVSKNSLMNQTVIGEMADQVPVFKQQGADTRIKHCEFVSDVVVPAAGSAFDITQYPIDPTNEGTFPWLTQLAKKYQRYKVRGMVIGYRSTSTDYNNSGVVAIAVNYDPSEDAYTSMEGLLNTKFAVSTKPSQSMLAPVECDPARSPTDGYYIKHLSSHEISDATMRQTQMGTINVATSGLSLSPGTVLGQLYVSYDIEFLYPYLHASQFTSNLTSGLATTVDTTSQTTLNNALSSVGFGDMVGYSSSLSPTQIGWKWNANNNSVGPWYSLIMPAGKYRVYTVDSAFASATVNPNAGTVVPHSAGSAVTFIEANDYGVGYTASNWYEMTVANGSEAQRTFSPGQVELRGSSGAGSLSCDLAIVVIRLLS